MSHGEEKWNAWVIVTPLLKLKIMERESFSGNRLSSLLHIFDVALSSKGFIIYLELS